MSKESVKELKEFAADNKIVIANVDAIPELAIAEIITQNPFNVNDDGLYYAPKKFITMAKMQDGKIIHHRQVSDQFRVTPYETTIQSVLGHVLGSQTEFGIPEVKLKFSAGGGNMYCMLKFGEIELNVGTAKNPDKIFPLITIRDAIDLSGKYEGLVGGVRFACTNGMIIAHPDFQITKFRMMHKTNTYQLGNALEAITASLGHISKATDLWKNYVSKTITTLQLTEIMDASGLSLRSQEKLVNLPLLGEKNAQNVLSKVKKNGQLRAWDAYNAITQFATHHITNPKVEFEVGLSASSAIDAILELNELSF